MDGWTKFLTCVLHDIRPFGSAAPPKKKRNRWEMQELRERAVKLPKGSLRPSKALLWPPKALLRPPKARLRSVRGWCWPPKACLEPFRARLGPFRP